MRQYLHMNTENPDTPSPKGRFDWLHVLLIVLVTILLTAAGTFWLARSYLYPAPFEPVRLSPGEEQVLNAKLEQLAFLPTESRPDYDESETAAGAGSLEPEPYSEQDAQREIALTEKELNAMLARNTDLARKLAIDLSGDLVSAKLLVPVDEDFPILGGKTLKVRAGAELAFREGRPVVALKGVSVMGVPLPNAWLGGLKNIDLVREFGAEDGFWKAFAAGVEYVRVREGQLVFRLQE